MSEITVSVRSVNEILSFGNLNIPDYQRPYKWERRHIRNLYYDVCEAMKNGVSEYRIGSIILHDNRKTLDIVDGQQRLISISLFLYAVSKKSLPSGAEKLLSINFIGTSTKNAKSNYAECESLINLIDESERNSIVTFIKEKCRLFVISLPQDSLDKAFQLFDSQNNRGKALDPHDLLKAYHLRAIASPSAEVIKKWEEYVNCKELSLKDLFDKYLFRVRRWANGSTGLMKKKYGSELKFSERFIDDFKGVNLDNKNFPYLNLYAKLKDSQIDFPNSLTMPIINGEAFFKFVEYSHELFKNNASRFRVEKADSILTSYNRKYSRNINLYMNMMVLFMDRFGEKEITKEVCEKVFIWSFFPRIESKLIYDSTIANYAGNGTFRKKATYQKMFQVLSASSTPDEFISKIDMDALNNSTVETIISKLTEEK